MSSLEEPSPTITSRLKLETTYTCYNVIDTFALESVCKTERRGLTMPFTSHIMLAH